MISVDETYFDVAILDTSLACSVLAASLARKGKRVLHLDVRDYYGAQDAAFTLKDFCLHLEAGADLSHVQISAAYDMLPQELRDLNRKFALSLRPALVPAMSPFVDALVHSGVANYANFRLLESQALFTNGSLQRIPTSKEEIFKSQDMSLIQKRRLMKFIQFAMTDFAASPLLEQWPQIGTLLDHFGLQDEVHQATLYGLLYCKDGSESSEFALQRLQKYLKSFGRYGTSPFLIAQYGGLSEILQGFCRICAVQGGLYILGREQQIKREEEHSVIHLNSLPDEPLTFKAKHVVKAISSTNAQTVTAHAVLISTSALKLTTFVQSTIRHADVDIPLQDGADLSRPADSGIIIFPPSDQLEAAVTCIMHGSGIYSTPDGYYVYYLCSMNPHNTPASALLEPVITSLLSQMGAEAKLSFSAFYNTSTFSQAYNVNAHIFQSVASSAQEWPDQDVLLAQQMVRYIVDNEEEPLFTPIAQDEEEDN